MKSEKNNELNNKNKEIALNSLKSLTEAKELLNYLINKEKISIQDIESYHNNCIDKKKQKVKNSNNNNKKKLNLFSKCRMRHIALHFSYNGAGYTGYAETVGSSADNSVEKHLFEALQKTCLISSRSDCSYSRCGRTDKGVSANGQIIALRVRSNIGANAVASNDGEVVSEDDLPSNSYQSISIISNTKNKNGHEEQVVKSLKEMDYCKLLNKVLPENIRALGWTPVTSTFSARFSCSKRTYRYFFLIHDNNYDISSMKEALQSIIGTFDFRNLCKMNIEQVSNFNRLIYDSDIYLYPPMISTSSSNNDNDTRQVGYFEICGQAFLWHQIRCIASILFLIGKKLEKPILFQQLIDITNNPSKPSYTIANELPLVLHSCYFNNLTMTYSVSNLFLTMHVLEQQYEECVLRSYRILDQINMIKSDTNVVFEDLRSFLLEQNDIIRHKNNKSKKGTLNNNNTNTEMELSKFEKSIESKLKSYKENNLLSWGEANQIIFSLLPSLSNTTSTPGGHTNVYIPIMERCRGTTYEQKILSIGGKRKEKYIENCVTKKKSKEEDSAFYKFMLEQGSNSANANGNDVSKKNT